ncbi:MAG TPA: hypothetical protein VGI82_03800 [Chitinophagaceae bacterium]
MKFYLLQIDESTLPFLYIIGFFVWLIILFQIIRSATKAKAIVGLMKVQADLLKEIALKNGVEQERIEEILKQF